MKAQRRDVDGTLLEEVEVPARAALLGLEPHPEGGWYRRTWTAPATLPTPGGVRPAATAILFLLPPGEASIWHRVLSDELWIHHGPGAVLLQPGGDGPAPEPAEPVRLDAAAPQSLVPAGTWQRTVPSDEEVLVTCVVSPGFDFADFQAVRPPVNNP